MRIVALLVALLCAATPCEAGYIPCPTEHSFYRPYYKRVRESNDERVSALFAEVVTRAAMTDKKFALCESDEFSPGIFPLTKALDRFALVVPKGIGRFSDKVILGLIAHEIGHTKRMSMTGGKTEELQADLQAVDWVGSDPVLEMLHAMYKNIHRFPKWQQDFGRYLLRYRINALVYGLYEVY